MPRTTPPKDPPEAKAGELITKPSAPWPMVQELTERRENEARYNECRELAIAEFGDGLPYVRDIYIAENRRDTRYASEAAVRIGRRLIVMKACEGHGGWLECLSIQGMDPTTASRMMMVARRLSALPNVATSQDLIKAADSQGKLFELLSLPEDQFAELAETGETSGLTLDAVEKLTVRELRAAVRDARGDIDAKDTRAANQEREIESLRKQLSKARLEANRATPDETAAKLRDKCQIAAGQCCADVLSTSEEAMSLCNRFTQLRAHAADQGNLTAHDAYLGGLIGEVMAALRSLRDEIGLPIVGDHGDPNWSTGG